MHDRLSIPGVSGITVDVPRLRVDLKHWCDWTGNPWSKVQAVVGTGFRMCARDENAYTMAANAVLKLIDTHTINPADVGFLGLGTESSTDNAAGAVIVKGMVDQALRHRGRPALARDCEVPEFKHACLGGVYALKGALRYVATDGQDRLAIVVSSDIAEYERGSSGEQTQGAGAVAMLVEPRARLFGVELHRGANAADYRGLDFRKPMARHFDQNYARGVERRHDFPIFNGPYSTLCYAEEVARAVEGWLTRTCPAPPDPRPHLDSLAGVFLHRPYQHMPLHAMAFALAWAALRRGADPWVAELAKAAGIDPGDAIKEIDDAPAQFARVLEEGPNAPALTTVDQLARAVRRSEWFRTFVEEKMSLGQGLTAEFGNLYTASLPAWLAAAFEDALERGVELAGRSLLAVGYGSGDAAEALSLVVAPGWREMAGKIGLGHTLESAVCLEQQAYEDLHDGRHAPWAVGTRPGFVIDRVGASTDPKHQDLGVEYYRLR